MEVNLSHQLSDEDNLFDVFALVVTDSSDDSETPLVIGTNVFKAYYLSRKQPVAYSAALVSDMGKMAFIGLYLVDYDSIIGVVTSTTVETVYP